MSFYPENGLNSKEQFSSSLGFTFENEALQALEGGYLTLVSSLSGNTSIFNAWSPVNNWSFEHSLATVAQVTGSFSFYTGSIMSPLTGSSSGYQGIDSDITAWKIFTSYPTGEDIGTYGIALDILSPNTLILDSTAVLSNEITIEFDVAVTQSYSGITWFSGYSSGQTTGIPALSGIHGHGILYCDGLYWDFIEVTPYGLRSYNSPDVALNINLYSPKRIRLGFRDNDIFISSEDGRTVAGYNKFTTIMGDPSSEGILLFGAPGKDQNFLNQKDILSTSSGAVGETYWDNIKVLTGATAIFDSSIESPRYSTGFVSCYTPVFNPDIAIESFVSATVDSVIFNGGVTQVSVQYSGVNGWTTYETKTITQTKTEFDLFSIPVYVYPRTNGSNDYLKNPLRFKIDQRSYSGYVLPPLINEISVTASSSPISLDIVPNWKPYYLETNARIDVVTGQHQSFYPSPTKWTNFLFNCPITTGQITSFEEEKNGTTISVVGTGEVSLDGPYRSSFKNYIITGATPKSGSAAFIILGSSYQDNYFSNGLFESFRPVVNIETGYYSGLTDGFLADQIYINRSYTGGYKVEFTKDQIYRLDIQGQNNADVSELGTSATVTDYAQGVYSYPGTGYHNGTVGIEAYIPSGIASGNLLISFDLAITKGSGINVVVSGSNVSRYLMPGDSYREYSRATVSATNNGSNFYIGFTVPSGYYQDEIEYSIDNLSVQNYYTSYLTSTGYTLPVHLTGTNYTGQSIQKEILKGSTVFYSSVFLDSYPSSNSGILFTAVNNTNKKLELNINSSGYLSAVTDLASNAWATSVGTDPYNINLPRTSITSEVKIPLSKWVNIGFMHDVHYYDYFGHASIDAVPTVGNFTSSNKLLLTLDGSIIASKDVMSGWQVKTTSSGEAAPFGTYIPLTGTVNYTLASGLFCKIDGVHFSRPPAAEAEAELSCLGARTTYPYFVPDALFKNGSQEFTNLGSGVDYFEGLYYNLSSLYNTCWDRGPIRNHLLFYNTTSIDLSSPYGELYSTRFYSGSYAVSPYSSAFERIFNATGAIGIPSRYLNVNSGVFNVLGWMYPRTEGTVFSFLQNSNDSTKARLELKIYSGKFIANKIDNTNAIVTSFTGQDVELNEWSYFNLSYTSNGYNAYGNTGVVTCVIGDNSYTRTGVNYGLIYLGKSGSTEQSCFRLGGTSDVNLFNVAIPFFPITSGSNTGDKGGTYQVLLEDNIPYTGGEVRFDNYNYATTTINASQESGNRFFSMAMFNCYETNPKLNGIIAYDNVSFKETESYQIGYDLTPFHNVFGTTDSPIRLGTQVPSTAINIARFSSVGHSVPSSISTIDLSDRNTNNLIPYKEGEYIVGKNSIASGSAISSYKGINSGVFSGLIDVIVTGQVASADIEISNISISDPLFDYGYSSYYYYLVGRGKKVVKILNAYPHYTGQLTTGSTGSVPDNYFANLEKIKSSIKLKTRKGEIIDKATYPYDIIACPYTPDSLLSSVTDIEDIYLDNIGDINSGEILDDGLFSVIILTNINKINSESIFVHYDGYDINEGVEYFGSKEVLNPQPIFRLRHESEDAGLGKFDLTLNNNSFYDLKIFGIEGLYSGQL